MNITPDQYYRPGQGAVWYNLALNNMGAALLIAGTGLLFSIPTIIMLLFNGLMIGFIIALSAAVHSFPTLLAGMLPHGILEIPALLLAGAIGLRPLGLFARRSSNERKFPGGRKPDRTPLCLLWSWRC